MLTIKTGVNEMDIKEITETYEMCGIDVNNELEEIVLEDSNLFGEFISTNELLLEGTQFNK